MSTELSLATQLGGSTQTFVEDDTGTPAAARQPVRPGRAKVDSEQLTRVVHDFLKSLKGKKIPELTLEAQLGGDLGLDSLEKVELLLHIEKQLAVSIDPDRSTAVETIGDLLSLVNEVTGADLQGIDRRPSISDLEKHLIREVPQFLNDVDEQHGRMLKVGGKTVYDFASANYLGLDLDERIFARIHGDLAKWGTHPSWTRAVASPRPYVELEEILCTVVGVPQVLVFPTVTLIHMGVMPVLAGTGTLFLMDERAHKSIQEGAALATTRGATTKFFRHNDLSNLKAELDNAQQYASVYICVDGVYSMTGDEAKVTQIIEICKDYPNATLYIDDAHGFGILGSEPGGNNPYGSGGGGLLRKYDLDVTRDRVIYVAALSKSFSSLAAFITCRSSDEREFFSTASTFVNSGPCPVASLASAIAGLTISRSREGDAIRRKVHDLTRRFVEGVREVGLVVQNEGYFPLVSVEIGSIAAVTQACKLLWEKGVLITPAVYPNAPIKRSMVRFTITAANTAEEIDHAIDALEIVRDQIPSAPYN